MASLTKRIERLEERSGAGDGLAIILLTGDPETDRQRRSEAREQAGPEGLLIEIGLDPDLEATDD